MTQVFEIRLTKDGGAAIYRDGVYYLTVASVGEACAIIALRHADELRAAALRVLDKLPTV
jgi:hypothetical protein